MLQGSSIQAHLSQSENSALAAVNHLAVDASRGLLVGTQLPPFVGVKAPMAFGRIISLQPREPPPYSTVLNLYSLSPD